MWLITKTWSLWLTVVLYGFFLIIFVGQFVHSIVQQSSGGQVAEAQGPGLFGALLFFLGFRAALSHILFLKEQKRRLSKELSVESFE